MFSRREFLKKSSVAFFSWPLLVNNYKKAILPLQTEDINTEILGRILFDNTPSFVSQDEKSKKNGFYQFNDVISLSQPITNQSALNNMEIWFGVENNSYIHSRNIQLVKNETNLPQEDIARSGRLVEVTVPFTEAWLADSQNNLPNQMFFYGSTHWVHGLGKDINENLYYLVKEDRWFESYYVDAKHLRIIDDNELIQISPQLDLERKKIIVDTTNQVLIAYEDNNPVMVSAISTGLFSNGTNLSTPIGEFSINYKRPSRHMVHSDKIGINDNELYGVPWVSYFTDNGIAFHGTYWHNDYSQPHSHGCVNLPIHAAKWIYLWTDPVVPPREKKFVSKYGTEVLVI